MDDQLLQQVAEIRGMPASLVERSAQARADKTGTTVEAVLREWLGEADAATDEPEAVGSEPTTDTPQPAAVDAVPSTAVTTDDLVRLAAETRRMPPKLILASAEARAEHSGSTLERVLADWAGVDLDELAKKPVESSAEPATPVVSEAVAPRGEPAPEPASEPAPAVATAPAASGGALSMDELLAKVAEVKGMPAALAQRSAEARAKKTGEPLEAILAEWAGIDAPSPSAAPAPEPASEPAPAVATDEVKTPAPAADAGAPGIEVIEASAQPDEVDSLDGGEASAKRGSYPMWLAAAFILIPLLAVAYILVSPNGPDCGSGGQLLVDPATGEAVNCDGGAYGETTVDNFAAGGGLYTQCVACHSGDGSGGVGPAFAAGAILVTFPGGSCSDQISWVSLGTAGWPDPTYGATNKRVGGVGLMPGFGTSLTEQQVAQVVLYERVAFGGQPLEEAEIDCGLVEASDG